MGRIFSGIRPASFLMGRVSVLTKHVWDVFKSFFETRCGFEYCIILSHFALIIYIIIIIIFFFFKYLPRFASFNFLNETMMIIILN